ncbi:hypothetical protein AOLI_G00325710 [Acnodon oligacanthus]
MWRASRPRLAQLRASFFRLLCLLPAGVSVRSADLQRATDNITIRQGDTAVIRSATDQVPRLNFGRRAWKNAKAAEKDWNGATKRH